MLLTGCCGYIGAWTTIACLRAGFAVRGTSVEPDHARALYDEIFAREPDGAALAARLEIVPAELMRADDWRGLAEGCAALVHLACPVLTAVGAASGAVHDPAVIGTGHVMDEAARAGVGRVLYMSSVVALIDQHRRLAPTPDERVGPADWNETASPHTDPYAFAKVRAERAARARITAALPDAVFASILPGAVIGPPLGGDRLPASVEKTFAPLLGGRLARGAVDLYLALVDVRDVAAAVVEALRVEPARVAALGAEARFICVAPPPTSLRALADAVRAGAPEYGPRLPRRTLPLPRWLLLAAMRFAVDREAYSYTRAMLGRPVVYDASLTEELLGLAWRPLAESVAETVAWLQARGHYPPPAGRAAAR